ncbi:MAG: hypothetical protein COA78_17830 [Blastopirellula sp.]|nr:MAG: hypothetical protein COA78_17830 [Blastopirellula sp.]
MKRRFAFTQALLACLVCVACSSNAWAAEKTGAQKSAAQLLPGSTMVYAELSEPKVLLDLLLEHPLRERIEQLDQVKKAKQTPQYLQFQIIVSLIELQIGMKWNEAFNSLTEGGISVGFDPKTDGVALLAQSESADALENLRDTFLKLARNEAQRKGNPDPIKTTDYRGITTYSVGEAKFATLDSLLIVVNNDELGKTILDNYLDDSAGSLADNEQFQNARKTMTGKPTLWAYLDVATVRAANPEADFYNQKNNNVALELLIGGLIGTAQKTPYLTASLDIDTHRLALNLSAPHDPDWIGPEHEYFFGPGGQGAAPPLLEPKENLLSLSIYRDFSSMWLNSADIFTDKVDAEFAQANANLATLFSGKDFGEEVLGSFQPEVQFVATRQHYEEDRPIPAIKIPAFALVFRFKNPEPMRADFRRMFQSLIGFLNITGAQNGQPQLDQDIEKLGDHQILTSTYAPEADKKLSEQNKINFNFSPSVAFAGDAFVVSSTSQLARELVQLVTKPRVQGDKAKNNFVPNIQLNTDFSAVRDTVNDNRNQLVTQTILSEGKERDEAEKQVDLILEALGAIQNLSLHLDTNQETVQFELEVNLAK